MKKTFKQEKLEHSIKEIVAELSDREARQDEVLRLQREVIRDCALAIRHIHTSELAQSRRVIGEIEKKIAHLRKLDADLQRNSAQCYQEYVEIKALDAIFNRQAVPSRQDLGVDTQAYLNGLADTVGELRRSIQLALSKDDFKDAEYFFNVMNEVYDNLMLVKFSSSLVGPLKHKQDVIRGQLEASRSEMLRAK